MIWLDVVLGIWVTDSGAVQKPQDTNDWENGRLWLKLLIFDEPYEVKILGKCQFWALEEASWYKPKRVLSLQLLA